MKNLSILYLLIFSLAIQSCKKKDDSPPSITMKGDSTVVIALYSEYTDSGITVSDNKNVVLIDTITNLKVDSTGNYFFRFVAIDKSGNYSTFDRNIIVELQQYNLLGKYLSVEYISSGPNQQDSAYKYYPVFMESEKNDKVLISNFGGYGSTAIAEMIFTPEGSLTIPEQPFEDGTLSGTGVVNYNGKVIQMSYELEFNGGEGTDIVTLTSTKID